MAETISPSPEDIEGSPAPAEPGRPWWRRFWRDEQEPPESPPAPLDREIVQEISGVRQEMATVEQEQRELQRQMEPEKIQTPNTPEELVAVLATMTAARWREKQLEKRYEGRLSWLRQWLAGEHDFAMTEDGEVRSKWWNELGRKALITVFNRRTAVATGALAVIGVFTGGIGLPAAGTLFGAIAGRGAAEAWHSAKSRERGLREEIARSQFQRFRQLQELALQANQAEGEEREQFLTQLVDEYHQPEQEVLDREWEIAGEQKVWNKRRAWLTAAGGLLGGVAGTYFADLGRQVMTMDIDGDGTAHLVQRFHDQWHFAYNSAQEAGQAVQTARAAVQPLNIYQAGGHLLHQLGEETSTVLWEAAKNAGPTAGQIGAVLGGLWFGGLKEQARIKEDLATRQASVERRQKEQKENLLGQVERRQPQEQPAPQPQPPTETQPKAEEEEKQPTPPLTWQERFEKAGKTMPAVGQIWIIKDEQGKEQPVRIKTKQVLLAGERGKPIAVDILDEDQKTVKEENKKISLELLLDRGRRLKKVKK